MEGSSRLKNNLRQFAAVVSSRVGFDKIKRNVFKRRMPDTAWYQGDGAALAFLLGVQVITGMSLALHYNNDPANAYRSVVELTDTVTLGGLLRALHYWSAGAMVVMLFFHLLRHILLGGYKPPREATWLVGSLLLYLTLAMSFTGYTLRWDERAIYAMRVFSNMLAKFPLIGEDLVLLIQGGYEIGPKTLSRYFALHVIIIPIILLGLVAYHIYLVIALGVTAKIEREIPVETAEEHQRIYKEASESERGEMFHPTTMSNSLLMAFVVFSIAYLLAYIRGPAPLYPEANLTAPSMPAEEWWFWWYSALIAKLPPDAAHYFIPWFPILAFVALVLLPFIDHGANRGILRRPFAALFVLTSVLLISWLSSERIKSPWTAWPDPSPPEVPSGIELSDDAQEGRLLFAEKGCTSCHAVSGKGRKVGPDIATLEPPRSIEQLRAYIAEPPPGTAMPSYGRLLATEELNRLADFCLAAQTFPLN